MLKDALLELIGLPGTSHGNADKPLKVSANTQRPVGGQRRRLLTVKDLHGYYGESHVLHGVNFHIDEGEVVTLLGRNGAGKTTTLRAIMGLLSEKSGSVKYVDQELVGHDPYRIGRLGIAYCPEERGIFSSLSVEENLMLPPNVKPGGMAVEHVYELFPNLRERRNSQGTKLSGGEQQMLAIGRILRTGANLLLLDEPTEGLAPVIVEQIGRVLKELKSVGYTILLVEQNFHFAASIADRHYVMEYGAIKDAVSKQDLEANSERLDQYLSL